MKHKVLTAILLFCLSNLSLAQQQPKIALVLSGGGAKGLAHIPLLQTLDSLGVKPDLIVGTSMGAIVGSLYAMGYSGDTIAHIAKNIDWSKILSNKIALSSITTAEKDEFGKYAFELGIRDGKIDVPLGIIDGQELSMLLSRLCYPSANVKHFDELPIPFRCVATDLVNGKKVIFESGNLATAIRASMAIPTIFTPVEYEETILVDGGVFDNYPVNVAQELGGEIIIGSDVSGGLSSLDELKSSPLNVMFQTAMMPSLTINAENQANTTVLFNHVPNLTYGTGDFNAGPEIIEQGRIAVDQQLKTLVSLNLGSAKSVSSEYDLSKNKQSINIVSTRIEGVDPTMERLLISKLAIDKNEPYSLNAIEEKLRYAYGTRFLQKLDYRLVGTDSRDTLILKGTEKHKHNFNTAFHYDTERGAGIIFNYTARNLFGHGSRLLATIDAAENPGGRLQAQTYFGKKQRWWTRAELFYEQVIQSFYLDGARQNDFRYRYGLAQWQINRDLSINDYLGLGVKVEDNQASPKIKPSAKNIHPDSLSSEINSLDNINFGLFARYHLNTTNKRYFPTSGTTMYFEGQFNTRNNIKIDFYSNQLEEFDERIKSTLKLEVGYSQLYPISKKLQLQSTLFGGNYLQFNTQGTDLDFFDYGIMQYFFLGGLQQRASSHFIPFPGLKVGEIPASQILLGSLGLQWEVMSSTYIIPTFNVAAIGQGSANEFYSNILNFNLQQPDETLIKAEWLYSVSTNFAYMSFLGPVQLEVSTVNFDRIELFFSFGYIFR